MIPADVKNVEVLPESPVPVPGHSLAATSDDEICRMFFSKHSLFNINFNIDFIFSKKTSPKKGGGFCGNPTRVPDTRTGAFSCSRQQPQKPV
ncbi:hypothetical protein SpiGrapes_1634 [Sphaerochaeta pleomorpha str. Grapes]|uniref:Uncharacterized protein n=1 Tax=Sphaerochaeta pleomorpha (strain ATCC BAA-1885 / DSM 22778 / Grapes) TaxID=158190 RepID=G8QWE3_SPHPG|nr:hypothetical protein [Sphaerochaeta pleomorpha]AEV29441.1 hypothetical protein SpiGrapes_1634 [Sphaerochaeta pleomorpha str. Grapes]